MTTLSTLPKVMKAAVVDAAGPPEAIHIKEVPVLRRPDGSRGASLHCAGAAAEIHEISGLSGFRMPSDKKRMRAGVANQGYARFRNYLVSAQLFEEIKEHIFCVDTVSEIRPSEL